MILASKMAPNEPHLLLLHPYELHSHEVIATHWPTVTNKIMKGMGCGFKSSSQKSCLTLWMVSVGKPSSPAGGSHDESWDFPPSPHQLGSHTSGHTEAGRPVLIRPDECSPCWYPKCDLTKRPWAKTHLADLISWPHRTMWDDMCPLLLSATKLQDNLLLSNR